MFLSPLWIAALLALAPSPAQEPEPPLMQILTQELQYSMEHLELPGGGAPYYLAYTVHEEHHCAAQASLGALTGSGTSHARLGQVDARMGDYALDNTHQIRGGGGGGVGHAVAYGRLPLVDDEVALRHVFWRMTDGAAKAAAQRYQNVLTNLKTKVEEEQQAEDFSREEPQVAVEEAPAFRDLRLAWEDLARRVSARARDWPEVLSSQVALETNVVTRVLVTSEGARLVTHQALSRIALNASTRAEDGMDLSYAATMDARDPADLPDEAAVAAEFDRVLATVMALRAAPLVEPFSGPAILRNRASGVFFHEIFGHRIEGHRQKDVEEGQTFAKKVGEAILPSFLSVTDDPTRDVFGTEELRGTYTYDDEGVPAQAVPLVEGGVLRTFLMSRTPLEDVPRSNGHGRRSPGNPVVARQGNLIVSSDRQVPFEELRAQLVAECGKQGKEYGLLFEDISGGFTTTQRAGMQAFKVLPLVVYRVYVDGRPDELVRGVDVVGTPLACFEEILATGDDPAVFNGTCGAESGPVPVSAISPSILVRNIEIEKRQRGQEKQPILAAPEVGAEGDEDPLLRALDEELARTRSLTLEGLAPPCFIQYALVDEDTTRWVASQGALHSEQPDRSRNLDLDLRVGTPELDNSRFANIPVGIQLSMPLDDDVRALRQSLWLATDTWYKQVVEILSRKQAYMKDKTFEDRPPDFRPRPPLVDLEELPEEAAMGPDERAAWRDLAVELSATFREFPELLDSEVMVMAGRARRTMINSEGLRLRQFGHLRMVRATAELVAADGTRFSDFFQVAAEEELPPLADLQARARAMVAGLRALAAAPILEEYTGPVLFEDAAACQLFADVLGPGVLGYSESVGEPPGSPLAAVSLERRLGKRILRPTLQVVDDPSVQEYQGEMLMGGYDFDDEGVPSQRVTLVRDGVLEDLLMSRAPIRSRQESNGHGRESQSGGDPIPAVGNLFVEDTAGVPLEKLRQALLDEADDLGLEHALRVVRLQDLSGSASQDAVRSLARKLQQGGLALADPLEVYRINVADGTEERVRGAEFRAVTTRLLRDLLEVGDTPTVHHHVGLSLRGVTPNASVLAPPVLVEEMELFRLQRETDQPPVLPTPLQRMAGRQGEEG